MAQNLSADFQRDEGRVTGDGMNWEGNATAEQKLIGKS
jgi:hypothetical protein